MSYKTRCKSVLEKSFKFVKTICRRIFDPEVLRMSRKLSILRLFESVGFLLGSYEEDSGRFRHSFRAFIRSYTTLFFAVFSLFNLAYCWNRFGPDDRRLMLIYGDLLYYFSPDTKVFVAFTGWQPILKTLKNSNFGLNPSFFKVRSLAPGYACYMRPSII